MKTGRKVGSASVWTEERKTLLKKLHSEGWCVKDIAREFGTTVDSIHWGARQAGVTFRHRNNKWRNEDTDLLRKLAEEGFSVHQVAKRMGRHYTTIRKQALIHGVELSTRPYYQAPPSLPPEKKKDTSKIRNCLSCLKSFQSEWAGDRVCGRCKRMRVWKSGGDYEFMI